MKCPRCSNTDPAYFYKGSKGYYCRKCIRFSRVLLKEELEGFDYEVDPEASEYAFSYELSKDQKEASDRCLRALENGDVLLHCVCGAGKTEIAVESIASYLARGLKDRHPQHLDEDEFINLEAYTLDEVRQMIYDGKIQDSKTIVGILLYASKYHL